MTEESSQEFTQSTPSRSGLKSMERLWLFPGRDDWEWFQTGGKGEFERVANLSDDDTPALSQASLVGLPSRAITTQLFWLDTTEVKEIPSLLEFQCERCNLRRNGEIFHHQILRKEEERTLVQVTILDGSYPESLGECLGAEFEVAARCLGFPPNALCIWKESGFICAALSGAGPEEAPVHFQSFPHQTLSPDCVCDLGAYLMLASAQNWCPLPTECFFVAGEGDECPASIHGLAVKSVKFFPLRVPSERLDFTPDSIKYQRRTIRRKRQLKVGLVAALVLYVAFIAFEVVTLISLNRGNENLANRLESVMPEVLQMQDTARLFDALGPAMDPEAYPLEILRNIMGALPEGGVRLTRFEITNGRIDLAGESSNTREAYDFLRKVQESPDLKQVEWENPPQPVPLPNNTARFTLRGKLLDLYSPANET